MKRTISILILLVMAVMLLGGCVNATTNNTLADELYALGAKYGMTSADKVRIERYLSEYPATEEEANQIMAKAKETVAIMETAGKTNVSELSKEQRKQLKTIANEAANIIDVTLTFKSGKVEIYKSGKLIETVKLENGKLAYTGNNVNVVLVVSSLAIVALITGFVARKKFANA